MDLRVQASGRHRGVAIEVAAPAAASGAFRPDGCPVRQPGPLKGARFLTHAVVLGLSLAAAGCVAPVPSAASPSSGAGTHRVWVVHHGHHSGIAVRAADVPADAWPARRDFPKAGYLEVGWGDRDYYMAPEDDLWLGMRALLWPTPSVLHVAAFDAPPERFFPGAGVIELALPPSGISALVRTVGDSHERTGRPPGQLPAGVSGSEPDWAAALGPGQFGDSLFYPSHERFHLFRTCNVWTAEVLVAAGVPLRPAKAITADSLFAQLRPHGRVLREPAPGRW